jgi:hypothetical protein
MIKNGVNPTGIKEEILLALLLIQPLFTRRGYSMVITSLLDGQHSRGSLHYKGLAVDLRRRHLSEEHVKEIFEEMKESLGSRYDVVLESSHYHIEYDPK